MKVAVIGASGHIGKAVCRQLIAGNHHLDAFTRSYDQAQALLDELPECFPDSNQDFPRDLDATNRVDTATTLRAHYGGNRTIDAVVYCVGHCPPGGFLEAVRYPLSQYPLGELDREIDMHIRGPLNIFQQFLPIVEDGGCFVFMSSAATRLLAVPREQRPPIPIYHHLAAIAAEDALIEGMRMDPEVKNRGIRIHRVAPPAIGDSPFHAGGPKMPTTVTTEQVVDAIFGSLPATNHQDVVMVPPPPAK